MGRDAPAIDVVNLSVMRMETSHVLRTKAGMYPSHMGAQHVVLQHILVTSESLERTLYAPALLKWVTFLVPGVSRRRACSSGPAIARTDLRATAAKQLPLGSDLQ